MLIMYAYTNVIWKACHSRRTYTRDRNLCPGWPVYEVKLFQMAGMREGGLPLSPAFQYLILMTWRACYLDWVMKYSVASKWQVLKVGMPVFQPFYEMKLKTSKFKVLAFWGQWRYHNKIQITSSSYHKNQILKSWWEWQPSLSHSCSLEHRHFTS